MIVTRAHPGIWGIRRRTIDKDVKLGPISLRFVTIAILAIIALFYLIQASQGESGRLRANELIREKEKLELQMKRLELESLRLRSLNELQKNSSFLEPVKELNFLPEAPAIGRHLP